MGRKAEQTIDKEEIIQVAYEIFSEKGYDGTNLDDIAARLNSTRTPVYYYFKNKKNLFYEVVRHYYRNIVNISKDIFDKDISIFDMFYEELIIITSSERPGYMALMQEVKRQNISSETVFSGGTDPLEELYHYQLQIVERAKETGDIRQDADARELLGMWYYFFYGVTSNLGGYLYDDNKDMLRTHGTAYIEMLRLRYQNTQ